MKDKYLEFYKTNFGTAKYCTKSWGLASFEAGAQSRQAEIDDLVDMVKTSADSEMNLFDELQRVSKDHDELQKKIDEALTQISNHYHSCIARKNLKRMCTSVSEIAEIEAHESNMTVLENILKGGISD